VPWEHICVRYVKSVSETEARVNAQGRVTIPVQIRREMGIEPGTSVVIYVEDGRVVLETRKQLVERLRRDIEDSWVGDPNTSVVDELIEDRRREAAAEEAADDRGGRT
jgi:AbrB family looped-hinge helix DNA binding protein